jgi:hypothetical protein
VVQRVLLVLKEAVFRIRIRADLFFGSLISRTLAKTGYGIRNTAWKPPPTRVTKLRRAGARMPRSRSALRWRSFCRLLNFVPSEFMMRGRWANSGGSQPKALNRKYRNFHDFHYRAFYWAQESIPSGAGWYENPICRICPPGYIGWRKRFLWIGSWAP